MVKEDIRTSQAVMELARDRPDWIPVLQAACEEAKSAEQFGGRFAGRWVLQRLSEHTGQPEHRPGLRLLVSYGLLTKSGESTRGGRRAYYEMPDRAGVEDALRKLGTRKLTMQKLLRDLARGSQPHTPRTPA